MMERRFRYRDEPVRVSATLEGRKLRLETVDGVRDFDWEELAPGDYLLRCGVEQRRCVVARRGDERWIWIDGRVHHVKVDSGGGGERREHAAGDLVAPMPGQVLKVLVEAGARVARNQPLVILEAMKMQYEIVAPRDGVVSQLCASEGEQVAGGALLVALAEDAGVEKP